MRCPSLLSNEYIAILRLMKVHVGLKTTKIKERNCSRSQAINRNPKADWIFQSSPDVETTENPPAAVLAAELVASGHQLNDHLLPLVRYLLGYCLR